MAETNKSGAKGASDKKDDEPQAAAPEEATYNVDRLVAESEGFFDEPPHVVAGALAGERKQNFTRGEAETAIKSWLAREVQS